jgi:hypothetical protein
MRVRLELGRRVGGRASGETMEGWERGNRRGASVVAPAMGRPNTSEVQIGKRQKNLRNIFDETKRNNGTNVENKKLQRDKLKET